MTRYMYEGPATRLVLGGITIVRGRVVELDGRAAEAAARHPGVREVGAEKAKAHSSPNQSDGLAARHALVARAKELGIPATGKSEALVAAIAAAEAAGDDDDEEDDAE